VALFSLSLSPLALRHPSFGRGRRRRPTRAEAIAEALLISSPPSFSSGVERVKVEDSRSQSGLIARKEGGKVALIAPFPTRSTALTHSVSRFAHL